MILQKLKQNNVLKSVAKCYPKCILIEDPLHSFTVQSAGKVFHSPVRPDITAKRYHIELEENNTDKLLSSDVREGEKRLKF